MTFNFSLDAKLSQAAYTSNNSATSPTINGWQPLQLEFALNELSPTFGAQLYKNGDYYKVVFRGTEMNLADWETNIRYGTFQNSPEFKDTVVFMARAIAHVAAANPTYTNAQAASYITTTGHSQGGFQAELANILYGTKGTSLDGMGASGVASQFRISFSAVMQANGMADLIDPARNVSNTDHGTRIYTAVGRMGIHAGSTDGAYSWSLTKAAFLVNPAAGLLGTTLGLRAHMIADIVANEELRDRNWFWRVIGDVNNPNDILNQNSNQIANTAVAQWGSVLVASLGSGAVLPDTTAVKNLAAEFLEQHAGQEFDIAYVGNNFLIKIRGGNELVIYANGSGKATSTLGGITTIKDYAPGSALSSTTTLQPQGNGTTIVSQSGIGYHSTMTVDDVTGQTASASHTEHNAQQQPIQRTLWTRNADGTTTTSKFDSQNTLQSTTNAQTFDDGSKTISTNYTDGRSDTSTYNNDQTLFSRDLTTPTPWGTSLVRTNGAGNVFWALPARRMMTAMCWRSPPTQTAQARAVLLRRMAAPSTRAALHVKAVAKVQAAPSPSKSMAKRWCWRLTLNPHLMVRQH